MKIINTRSISIFLSSTALLCPFILYYIGFYDPPETDGYVCGLYILSPIFATLISVFVLSMTGFIVGIFSFKTAKKPRSLFRKIEFAYLSLPLLLVIAYATIIVLFDLGIIG